MSGNRCFLCEGSHFADECTTYRSLEERQNAAETLKLCLQCLQPAVTLSHRNRVHLRCACRHCGKEHNRALCPLEPWRRGTTCAFCLGYHHSHACDTYKHAEHRIRALEVLKICRRCLSRSHMADDCPSMHRCIRCNERHHHALCPKKAKRRRPRIRSVSLLLERRSTVSPEPYNETKDNDGTDEIEVIRVVPGSKSKRREGSYDKKSEGSSSSPEYQKKVDKLTDTMNEGRRELRLAKEANRRAERELHTARKERDDAQDSCKALEKRIHRLEEENRNCETTRQVTAEAVQASIEIVTKREGERRRTIEQERDEAKKKLLEAEKRIEAFKEAASDAVRLTVEFQAWRIRTAIRAKKGATSQKETNNNREDVCAMQLNGTTAVRGDCREAVKTEAGEEVSDNARKRRAAPSAAEGKRRRTDSVKPSAEELSQRLGAVLGGYSESVVDKYRLFFAENLRGSVTIEELVEFVRLRCPSDVDLANNILKRLSTAP